MPGPEHEFVITELDRTLKRYAQTGLFGIKEAERSKFDYASVLLRDLSRPLVSQALWSNVGGIEKDLRTLLHEQDAVLKVYLVRDHAKYWRQIDNVLQSYRNDPALRAKLTGLRLIPVSDFDADSESQRQWMETHLEEKIKQDLVFGIVFGQLTARDFSVFMDHGGPTGLKFAILEEVCSRGLEHMPTFKKRLGYAGDHPIREALTMLTAAGFIRRISKTNVCIPAIKGRVMLDVSRRLMFEWKSRVDWAAETVALLKTLGMTEVDPLEDIRCGKRKPPGEHDLAHLLEHGMACQTEFGCDLLTNVNPEQPLFYSPYAWEEVLARVAGVPGISAHSFDEPASLFFAGERPGSKESGP